MINDERTEATPDEAAAMRKVWDSLGVLMSSGLSKLTREQCLAVCAGLSNETLICEWIIKPGCVRCSIFDSTNEPLYSFEFQNQRVAFAFAEKGTAN